MTFAPKIPAVVLSAIGGLLVAASAGADDGSFASRLNQVRTVDGTAAATVATMPSSDATLAFASGPAAGAPVLTAAAYRTSGMRYRPRRSSYPRYEDNYYRSRGPQTYLEFHGGFFDPDGEPDVLGLGGIKFGALVDPHISVGALVDWAHRGEADAEVVSSMPGPGGGPPITTQIELARSSVDHVPILAYLQFSGDNGMGLVPYAGVGGGYQLLFLSAEDFATGATYDATFGGWGWQAWAGLGIPLSRDTRLTAEVFRNGGNLTHDFDDPGTGYTVRETVNVDGTGARFGLAFSF